MKSVPLNSCNPCYNSYSDHPFAAPTKTTPGDAFPDKQPPQSCAGATTPPTPSPPQSVLYRNQVPPQNFLHVRPKPRSGDRIRQRRAVQLKRQSDVRHRPDHRMRNPGNNPARRHFLGTKRLRDELMPRPAPPLHDPGQPVGPRSRNQNLPHDRHQRVTVVRALPGFA